MFVSARMKKAEILTLVSDEPKVTEALGEMGVLHLTRAPAEGGVVSVEGPESHESEARLEALEARANSLCTALGTDVGGEAPPAPHLALAEVESELQRIEAEVGEITKKRDELAGARHRLERLLRDASMLRDVDAPVEQLEGLSFLHFAIGSMSADNAAAAELELGDRAVVLPYRTPFGDDRIVAISSKKGRWALETALEHHGFRREELPKDQKGVPSHIIELADNRLGGLLAAIRENNEAVRAAAGRYHGRLMALRRRLRTEYRLVKARENFAHTWATMLITGWLPADKVNTLCETVLDLTKQRAIIEIRDPGAGDEEPPTMMRNARLLRPFEMLVSAYSTPRYNEIEPTPLVAVLFILMFGLMFGDIGHSGLLLIAGVAMWARGRAKVRDAGVILTFCGGSGVLFGLLYGSVFGYELGGRRGPFIHPLENVNTLLAITIAFGVVVITMGIVLNIVNRLRRREYAAASFDRFGLVGGIFYWGAIILAARGVVAEKAVGWLAVLLLIVAPLVVLFVYRPAVLLLRRLRGSAEPSGESFFVVVMESAIEAFDAVLLYTANTLSFARIAAFALAHAGLSLAVFEIIKVVRTMPGGPVWVACAFVVGTLVIVLLEGLIVAIQSMRLQYYEFFSKFYRGEGWRYQPFSLKAD